MTGAGLSLDHVGAMVRDLDAGAEHWRRLGFQLAPRSRQIGASRPGGPTEPWATANHCAILRRGYLELIGIVDATRFNPWQAYMDRFEGIHIAAFRCHDADAAYGDLCRRAVDGFDAPVDRQRDAPFGEGAQTMKFRNIFSRDEIHPEGRLIIIEHQTPGILWQDALMRHPNKAVGLEAMFLVADDDATRDRMQAIAGVAANDGKIALPGGGVIEILDPARFAARFPGVTPPRLPWIAGCVVSVADLAAASRLITGNGVPLTEDNGRVWIAPEFANGGVMEFVQA